MRLREKWMNKATDPILELLDESGLALPPKAILVNLQRMMEDAPSRPTVFRALDELEDHGYIETLPISGTYYVITGRGRDYIRGELDASDLEHPDED
jgi:DNA-binding PadR family transcriptional regulator